MTGLTGATGAQSEAAGGGRGLQRGVLPAALWACFLGCSWTWIIGMVFPVLLLRDYGPWGWVVFAVPNVLGAAAMGVVLGKPQWSARLVERHRDMALRFSEVTIAYHAFVLGWLMMRLWGLWFAASAIGVILILYSRIRGDRSAGVVAVIVTLASLVWLGGGWWLSPDDAWVGVFREQNAITPRLNLLDLILFAPAALLGFLCCPYLDLTFHRARMATAPLTGMAAFVLGFGVVFLAMIVGTMMYAGLLLPALGEQPFALPQTWNVVLSVHLTIQLAFTVAIHAHEVARRSSALAVWRMIGLAAVALMVGWWVGLPPPPAVPPEALPEALQEVGNTEPHVAALTPGEVLYRLFLLAYGLIFPAYVWLCMLPTLRPTNPRTRRAIFIFGALVCLPMGWLFFIGGRSAWIIAIVAVLAALRIIVETTPRFVETPVQSREGE